MVPTKASAVAFSMPGGEACSTSSARPIDCAHLARQTMGDRALEQEVLRLFIKQALSIGEQITRASTVERMRLAHGLKGAARGVGAFAIAECAADIEKSAGDRALIARLAGLIGEARDFVAAINR